MTRTKIPYATHTWNPFVGCSHAGAGCTHCYAERLASTRLRHLPAYAEVVGDHGWNGKVKLMPERLSEPLKLRKSAVIFVGDMGDLYHPEVPFEFIAAVHGMMAECQQHTFLTFTKRAERRHELFTKMETNRVVKFGRHAGTRLPDAPWFKNRVWQLAWHQGSGGQPPNDVYLRGWDSMWPLPNVWQITSCSTQAEVDTLLPIALATPAAHRGVSLEPLVGAVDLTHIDADKAGHPTWCWINALTGQHTDMGRPCPDVPHFDWVVCGGESGPKARPCDVAWLQSIMRQCRAAGVPYYTKQLGSNPFRRDWPDETVDEGVSIHLRSRAGSDPSEWPKDLRVRETPWRMG